MYEAYFNLNKRPFASMPRIDHYFPAAGMEAARTTLIRCIERSEGTGMVIGPSGTGKTLLCQLLAEHFQNTLQVALLTGGHLGSRRALLQAILYELAQPYRGMDEGELRLSLIDHLTLSDDCPAGALLLIDEAHALPWRLLDEVRMLTNLARRGLPAIRLVLAGGCVLEERFASPRMESFSQRLTARCYLEALNAEQTQAYIHAWITAAGARGPELFPAETCQSVYKATDGVPRLINQLCDHAMLLACAAGNRRLERAHVEEAWADLQQLPTPWNEQTRPHVNGVVEFGRLDDDADEPPLASGSGGEPDKEEPPMLRISPQSEEGESEEFPGATSEPVEQLRHIQRLLADVEEEFQPRGAIGPEVELVFDQASHPFHERFDEEEVIADRYATAAEAGRVAAPPANAQAQSPDCGMAETAKLPDRDDSGRGEQLFPTDDVEPRGVSIAASARADACDPAARTVILHGKGLMHPLEPDDADMVVIEDGYEDAPSWPARAVVPVRRQEFGRLFAKLRRG